MERQGPRQEGSAVVVRGDGWVGRVRVAGAVPYLSEQPEEIPMLMQVKSCRPNGG